MKLGTMRESLPKSLAEADLVFCYSAKLGWDAAACLSPLGARAQTQADLAALTDAIVLAARPGDVVLVMSNGSFGGIHEELLARFAQGGVASGAMGTRDPRGMRSAP
jgi:UDP-N-acetylmuramate: L-alanyl-gamma-D-glutamyl-meso-diaminopimelate ligase